MMPYGKYKAPKSQILGTGMARGAAEKAKQRHRTVGERADSIMREIQNTRGGTQNFKKYK